MPRKPKFITEFKGDYRVRCWGPGICEEHYFDNGQAAMGEYMTLVTQQAFRKRDLYRVVYERLWDLGGEDKLAFATILDSRKGLKLS